MLQDFCFFLFLDWRYIHTLYVLERKWQPTPVFLPGKFHGQRSLVGHSPWGRKSQTWISDFHSHTYTYPHTHTYTHTYIVFICCYLVTKSCPTLCNPVDHNPPGYPWDSPGKNTRVGCHFLLQGVFPTHGSTHICIEKQVFYYWATWEAPCVCVCIGEWNGNTLTLAFLPGKSPGQRSLVGCSPWGQRVGHDWVTNTHTCISYIHLK